MSIFKVENFSDSVWRELELSEYLRKSQDPTSPEQYYIQLVQQQAILLTGPNKDFAIFHIVGNGIWLSAAYCTTGDFYEKYLDDFIEFIREKLPNIEVIRWTSYRRAYMRGIKNLGEYEVESVVYRKNIKNGT